MRSALLTGFEPFGGDAFNPSQRIAQALDGERVGACRVIGAVLPTRFDAALPALDSLLRRHRPALVLAVGQAGGREGISLERVAINLVDARIADNAGRQPIDERVIARAPNAYFANLPLKRMLAALHAASIPASLSHSAGTFVCNQVFFGLMHRLARRPACRGGFVHVPYASEQRAAHRDAPSLPLETLLQALRICLRAAQDARADARYAAGALH